jgi:hypothetical protein
LAIEVPVIPTQEWFWQECRRILKPGGMAIIAMSNKASYKTTLNRLYTSLKYLRGKGPKPGAESIEFYILSARDVVQMLAKSDLRLEQTLGFNWLPLGRTSNSFLVPALAAVEQGLGLRRLPFQSPWVLLKAKR